MKIQVTKKDIEDGQWANGKGCAIALAVKRATGIDDVIVSSFGITTPTRGLLFKGYANAKTNIEFREFIYAFDAAKIPGKTGENSFREGKKIPSPFSFTIPGLVKVKR